MSKIHEQLQLIRGRPGMFIGSKRITALECFVAGFQHAEQTYDWVDEHPALFPLPIRSFHEYVRVKLGYSSSTCGWCNMILEKNDHDEEKSLEVFFQMHEEFLKLKVVDCVSAVLSEENKHHLIHDPYSPKRVKYDKEGKELKRWPCYTDPEQIYILKLSDRIGYLNVVITEKEYLLEFDIFEHKKQALEEFHRYFGKNLNWTAGEWSDERLGNRRFDWA